VKRRAADGQTALAKVAREAWASELRSQFVSVIRGAWVSRSDLPFI